MDHALFQTRTLEKARLGIGAVSLRFCAFPPRLFVDPVQLNAKLNFWLLWFQRTLADNTILIDELYN